MNSSKLSREERRFSLIEAASRLFMEKGYHETKTKDIALAAGVTEPVIYKHFSGKQELFFEVIFRIASKIIDRLNFTPDADPEKFIQKFIYMHLDTVDKHFGYIKFVLIQLITEPEVREIFKKTLLPKMQKKIRPLIEGLNPGKEIREYDLFILGGMLMIMEIAQGAFKYSPDNLSRQELSEKLAKTFLSIIKEEEPKAGEIKKGEENHGNQNKI